MPQFPAPTQLPELAAVDGGKERTTERWKNACQESAGERNTEADFDAKSGRKRDRKQDQADRKVARFLGAFCKHHLGVSASNLIISTRATD